MNTTDLVAMLLAHSARVQRLVLPDVYITFRCGYQLGVNMRLK